MTTKVTFLVDKIIRGGGETLLQALIKEFDGDIQVSIWNLGRTNQTVVEELENMGVSVRTIRNYSTKEKYLLRPLPKVVSLLRSESPDVLHGYSNYTNVIARVAGSITGVPTIIGQHHGVPKEDDLAVWANVLTNRLADTTITVSDTVAQSIYGDTRSLRRKIAGGEVQTIYNGVDLNFIDSCRAEDRQKLRRDLGIRSDKYFLVNVGRLVPAKGQRTLLKAIEQFDDERVVLGIIGDGHLRDELEQQSKELGIDEQVRFFRRLSRPQTLQYMSVADIFISNSTREGFGIAFLEAMALGLATIVSDIPAHREVGDEDTSIFVPPKDPNRFARSLQQVSEDPERRDRLGKNGRESARKIYNISNISEEYQDIYDKFK